MNENINLCDILKNCPKGTKLFSYIHGEVEFLKIDKDESCYKIVVIGKTKEGAEYTETFTAEGILNHRFNGICILVPSKDQPDWNKFIAPWYKNEKLVELKKNDDGKIRRWIIDDIRYNMNNEPLSNSEYKKKAEKAIAWLEKQGEQNLPSTNERAWIYLVSDVLTCKDGIGQYLDDPRVQELAKRLCSEYAQKLYNPSAFSNSLNTGKNEQKFNPNMLKPFDKVLGIDKINDVWQCDFFSHTNYNNPYYPHVAVGTSFLYCIPYNEETKHLVGTTENAPLYYRYWDN